MDSTFLATDRQATDAIIRKFSPEINQITYIDHGYDNLVVLVNQEYVFRFPRDEAAGKRLRFEIALFQRLAEKITVVPIPEIVHVSGEPLFAVSKYIAGELLTSEQIQSLTADEQTALGETLATVSVQLNQAISGPALSQLRAEAGVTYAGGPWAVYFDQLFTKQPLPNELLRPYVDQYYPQWQQYTATEQSEHAIHDDLHAANLLFIGPKLSGLLDFGDANMGSVEEEMRGLYQLGEPVLTAAVAKYQALMGDAIDPEHIKTWAIIDKLAVFTDRLARHDVESRSFLRAQAYLHQWLPGFPL